MLCAISNAVPEEPVVCSKTGYVFEKSLIDKYLAEHGKHPITGEPMSESDVLPLKAGRPIKPRHTTAMHIPGILGLLHNEFDAVMLECFELRQELLSARQQLAHSLYQHDAACRVVARLMREKEAAQDTVEGLRGQLAGAVQQLRAAERPAAEDEPPAQRARLVEGMTTEQVAEVDGKQQELFQARSKRDAAPSGQALPESIENLRAGESKPLHSTTSPGILALALAPCAPDASPEMVATGGADHDVVVYDVAEDRIVSKLSGHGKKVTCVAFTAGDALVSGGADGAVKLWGSSGGEGGGAWGLRASSLAAFSTPVTALSVHPLPKYVLATARDGAWKLLDLPAERAVWSDTDTASGGVAAAAVHPDGHFFALGASTGGGGVAIYDVKTAKELTRHSEGLAGGVSSIAFHENGYWAALACHSSVHVLDLRKFRQAVEVVPFDAPVTSVTWDYTGKYLACAGPAVKVFEVKGKKRAESRELCALSDLPKKGVHCLAFAKLGHQLFVGAADHNLRVYEC